MEKLTPDLKIKEQFPSSLMALASKLEESSPDYQTKKLTEQLFKSFQEELHLNFISEVDKLYREMESKKLLLRLERLGLVVKALVGHQPIHLGEEQGNRHYANAVIPSPEGIAMAFAEGQASEPIRLLAGIGFNPNEFEVVEIDVQETDARDQLLRKKVARYVHGELFPEQIKYLILRIPRPLFSEEYLTENEQENEGRFIFRGSKL